MRRRWLLGGVGGAILAVTAPFAAGGSVSARAPTVRGTALQSTAAQASRTRSVQRLGWVITFPRSIHLEASSSPRSGLITISEVTLATFAPQRGIHTHVSHRGGRLNVWIRDYAPVDRAGRFPASAVAVRIERTDGGPPVLPGERGPRLPLKLSSFGPSGNLIHTPSSVPRPRQVGLTDHGLSYAVIVWVGRRASARTRDSLAEIVAALRSVPA